MTGNIQSPSAPHWRLSNRLAREDIAAFEFLPRELVGWEKLWVLGPILLCGAAAGLFQDALATVHPWDPSTRLGQLLSVLAAITAGYLASKVLLTARTRRRTAVAKLPVGNRTVTTFPDRFEVTDEDLTRTCSWADVHVIETGTHVFLCSRPRDATIVPLRAFKDQEDMRRFSVFARSMGADASGTGAPSCTDTTHHKESAP